MKSKTLKLIEQYRRTISEQGEDPNAMPPEDPTAGAEAPPEDLEPQVLQMTGDAEDNYISTIIDAALFQPSTATPEERQSLLNMQEIMMNKNAAGVTNAREEVLPIVLSIIGKENDDKALKREMDDVDV